MAGGMTYSEVRECYMLSGPLNKDVYIGTCNTCSRFPVVLSNGKNNQDQRIQLPLGNLLTISKFWNSVVLGLVQYRTESL